eukprot:GILI01030202.1.p1 GENE.GILI01030202.1~~GILI01030202.1.p1  ORF type:complete len:240 (-),score=21.06 GILI01030202.1:59-733(-)
MADDHEKFKISDRLLRLSTPRQQSRNEGSAGANSAAGTRPNSPSKKMTREEIEHSTSRMHSMSRKSKELPPILKSKVFTKEQEDKSTSRLYRDAVETQKKKRELSAERVRKSERCETKVVPQEEIAEMVVRMHDKTAEIAKRKAEVLVGKYQRPDTANHRKLTKAEETGVGQRLCTESSASIRSNKGKLYEKYLLDRLPKGSPRSQEELIDCSARLYRNEPRTD